MDFYPIFLSIVVVLKDNSTSINYLIEDLEKKVIPLVSDYEIIIVDNASSDNSLEIYKNLIQENGTANLQIYALTKLVDIDTASWVGIENALGDFVTVIDPSVDDAICISKMLNNAVRGDDIVMAKNNYKIKKVNSNIHTSLPFDILFNRIKISQSFFDSNVK